MRWEVKLKKAEREEWRTNRDEVLISFVAALPGPSFLTCSVTGEWKVDQCSSLFFGSLFVLHQDCSGHQASENLSDSKETGTASPFHFLKNECENYSIIWQTVDIYIYFMMRYTHNWVRTRSFFRAFIILMAFHPPSQQFPARKREKKNGGKRIITPGFPLKDVIHGIQQKS